MYNIMTCVSDLSIEHSMHHVLLLYYVIIVIISITIITVIKFNIIIRIICLFCDV